MEIMLVIKIKNKHLKDVLHWKHSLKVFSVILCSLQMFHRCQRAVTGLQSRCGHCTEQEERLLRNVVSSLAQSLQELSTNFRHTQSGYLKRKTCSKAGTGLPELSYLVYHQACFSCRLNIMSLVYIPGMKNREERSKHFFDSGPLMEEDEDLAVYDKVTSFVIQINPIESSTTICFAQMSFVQYKSMSTEEIRKMKSLDAGSTALCKF